MPSKTIVAVAVAALIRAAFSVPAADANKAQQSRYYTSNADPPSLDGRVLGYPRTCGSNTSSTTAAAAPSVRTATERSVAVGVVIAVALLALGVTRVLPAPNHSDAAHAIVLFSRRHSALAWCLCKI